MTNMFTLEELKAIFPPREGTCGSTGHLPMVFVEKNLEALAAIVKEHNLRRMYRGPRYDALRCSVRREDAYAMVLYRK